MKLDVYQTGLIVKAVDMLIENEVIVDDMEDDYRVLGELAESWLAKEVQTMSDEQVVGMLGLKDTSDLANGFYEDLFYAGQTMEQRTEAANKFVQDNFITDMRLICISYDEDDGICTWEVK